MNMDELKGKKFRYISPYSGVSEWVGEVLRSHTSYSWNFKDGELFTYFTPHVSVISTTGSIYKLSEVIIQKS